MAYHSGYYKMFLVSTDDMMADIFTKALDKTKFLKCRDYILKKP